MICLQLGDLAIDPQDESIQDRWCTIVVHSGDYVSNRFCGLICDNVSKRSLEDIGTILAGFLTLEEIEIKFNIYYADVTGCGGFSGELSKLQFLRSFSIEMNEDDEVFEEDYEFDDTRLIILDELFNALAQLPKIDALLLLCFRSRIHVAVFEFPAISRSFKEYLN
ncbi:hypothetical protein HK098_003090 [Nowakowskiella sp. JEL0407]|nr:hypothetical protein HK098_003090 [Nowakowskiella sp. JEL0407]